MGRLDLGVASPQKPPLDTAKDSRTEQSAESPPSTSVKGDPDQVLTTAILWADAPYDSMLNLPSVRSFIMYILTDAQSLALHREWANAEELLAAGRRTEARHMQVFEMRRIYSPKWLPAVQGGS